MGENTHIGWCDHTFNPWIGCQKVSAGCRNCYAESWSGRWYGDNLWGPPATSIRRRTSESIWRKPLKWQAEADAFYEQHGRRQRVFCASLADVFEDHPIIAPWRRDLFELIDRTPALDWLLLTKRPENIKRLWPFGWYESDMITWPNIWLGTSVEDQGAANERIPHLLRVPAAIRFLSCEPLLGPVDLCQWLGEINNGTEEYRRSGISGLGNGRNHNRSAGSDMADRFPSRIRANKTESYDPLSATQSGTRYGNLSDDSRNGERSESECLSPSPSLATFQRPNSSGIDNQSQEWKQEGQSPREPGTSNVFGASNTCPSYPGTRERSTRREECDVQAYNRTSCPDQANEKQWNEAGRNRSDIRSELSDHKQDCSRRQVGISWVIVGGESGAGARPMELEWARNLVQQAQRADVACFFKQLGSVAAKGLGAKGKGEDLTELPADLQIRAWPESKL